MEVHPDSRHVVVIRKGQFCESIKLRLELMVDWFDVLDNQDRPILNDREIFTNLKAIVKDADTTPANAVAASALGVLTTESRKIWSHLRTELQKSNKNNANSLAVVESALFVVCLDDYESEGVADICGNFLCGSYRLEGGVQVGTCTNRWYDKVCPTLSGLY
jgi:carnitine O-acetyltransferase